MRIACLLLAAVLAGCRSLYPYDETRYYFSVPAGSRLVLNRALIVPAEEVSVYLQEGKAYQGAPDRFQPYCKFELRDRLAESQRVEPDTFVIGKATRHWSADRGPIPWAARLVSLEPLLLDQDGPSFLVFSSFFYLHSAKQPHVLRMTCEYWGDPATGRFLSIDQIRRTLGEVFTLELNGPGELL